MSVVTTAVHDSRSRVATWLPICPAPPVTKTFALGGNGLLGIRLAPRFSNCNACGDRDI